uniref:Glycine rich superfamily member n=1 Tax=Rhipicephalus appendiculatus TaxID=34631 RepID=A0A131YD02_RHIAP
MKRLVLLNTLVILLAAAKAPEENNESEEDILEAIGSAAATLGHHVHRFFSAFVRGIEKEIAERRRSHAEKEEASKGAAATPPGKGGMPQEPSIPGSSQEGSAMGVPSPQAPQDGQALPAAPA